MITETLPQVLNEFDWSDFRSVNTKRGARLVRSATIPEESGEFWEYWNSHGAKLKARGFSLSKYQENWQISEWRMPDNGETEEAKAAQQELLRESRAASWVPDGIELPEELLKRLLPYQPDSVKRLMHALVKHNMALDGSDMGTGKSYVAAGVCYALGLRPAIICPLSVKTSWQRCLEYIGVEPIFIENYESLKTGSSPWLNRTKEGQREKFDWVIEQMSGVPKQQILFVFDEVQRMKTPSSLNAKMGIAAIRQGYRIVGCSGTIATTPLEMRVSGQLAKLHNGSDFYPWLLRNGCVKGGQYGMGLFYKGGQKGLSAIRSRIYPEHGTRLRKDELPDFPECDTQAEAFDVGEQNTKGISKIYDDMLGKLAEIEANGSLSKIERKGMSLAQMTKARQEAELLKLDAIVEMAEEAIEEGQSVVIFTNYRDSLAKLRAMLKTDCHIQGDQKTEERQVCMDAFQSDKERVIICNIQAGGVGVSLHDLNGKHPRLAIVCPTWSAFDLSQSLGRIHRAGAKSKAIQKVFFAAGTLEEDICERVREKLKNMAALNDSDLSPQGVF